MITVDDLYNWMDEYEEDPIVDGPVCITREHQIEFVNGLNKQVVNVEEYDDLSIGGGGWNDDEEKYIVESLVDFLNKKEYPNDYERDLTRDGREGYEQSEEVEGELFSMDVGLGMPGERMRMSNVTQIGAPEPRKRQPTIPELQAQMDKAIQDENYEFAAVLRDKINALKG